MVVVVLAVMLLLSTAQALLNEGLLVSLLLAIAPLLGLTEANAVFDIVGPATPTVLESARLTFGVGIPVGAVGFVLGTGARYAVRRLPETD